MPTARRADWLGVVVPGVMSGVGGCVPTVEPTHATVTLTPLPQDAGPDGD